MKAKFITIVFVFIASASAAAETNNMEAYYLANQDEALQVYDVCKELMREFVEDGDVKSITKLADDHQCNAAEKAVNLIASRI